MLNSFQKVILIPALTIGVGFLFSIGETKTTTFPETYPEHLAGAFTGGFGEQTCHSCHFDYDLNWEEGRLTVNGIPEKIKGGREYKIEILVQRSDLGKSGFQMTVRYPDGRQAGTFQISENERLMFTKEVPDSVKYVQHSEKGTTPVEEGRSSWIINWKAPESIADSVYFNISANAANGDQSEFGDWIYVKEFVRL